MTELATTEKAFEESLGYPDYKKLSRSGEGGRIIETKLLDAPKIFSPVILDVAVHLDKARNGVPLMEAEIPEVIRGYLGVPEDLIIDVLPTGESSVVVALRDVPVPAILPGHKGISRVHNVTLVVSHVFDTSDDEDVVRRKEISSALSADTSCDAIQVCVPQHWIIPDPEFKPKSATISVYSSSLWLLFFRNTWGAVTGSTVCFRSNFANQLGMISLVVKFKDHKALRQALLFLHRRYLIHPREGLGMRMTFAKPVNYQKTIDDAEGKISVAPMYAAARLPSLNAQALAQTLMRVPVAPESDDMQPGAVADAFRQMLEKLEKLEHENQRLVELLATRAVDEDDEEEDANVRERSPRGSGIEIIPAVGMPPWKRK